MGFELTELPLIWGGETCGPTTDKPICADSAPGTSLILQPRDRRLELAARVDGGFPGARRGVEFIETGTIQSELRSGIGGARPGRARSPNPTSEFGFKLAATRPM